MAEPIKSPPRLRVALLEPEPIRLQGFVPLFQDHPQIEFVVFELAQFLADQEFKGIALPTFYTARMPLKDLNNSVRAGMSGQAKIFGRRRSVANRIATMFGNVLHTHFW